MVPFRMCGYYGTARRPMVLSGMFKEVPIPMLDLAPGNVPHIFGILKYWLHYNNTHTHEEYAVGHWHWPVKCLVHIMAIDELFSCGKV